MPVVSVSLSEIGYDGYKSIPMGLRSKLVDKLLREYALKSQSVTLPFADRAISVAQVLENQSKMALTMACYVDEIKMLKKELKE